MQNKIYCFFLNCTDLAKKILKEIPHKSTHTADSVFRKKLIKLNHQTAFIPPISLV